jgi:C4-type Zn-finger protein
MGRCRKGTCPKCKQEHVRLTRHHVLPKCFFGGAGEILLICRECHDELEEVIFRTEQPERRGSRRKLPAYLYVEVVESFLSYPQYA